MSGRRVKSAARKLAGLVRVLAADPKLMELAYGRAVFDSYGGYAADPVSIVVMLEGAVAEMQARAGCFAGRQRDHMLSSEDPFTVVLTSLTRLSTMITCGCPCATGRGSAAV
jgi:hypothetical protein